MNVLSVNQIIDIHDYIINNTGGIKGIRDKGLLDQSSSSFMQSFNNEYLYKTFYDKLSIFVFSFIKNHPFIDGNKRIAFQCMMLLIKINGFYLNRKVKDDELINLIMDLASSKIGLEELKDWIHKNIF